MADDTDDSQKTEDPTPKKLEETREKGQVPLSKELNNWIMLLAATIVVVAMGGGIMTRLAETFQNLMINSYQISGSQGGYERVLVELFTETFYAIGLPVLFLVIAAIAAPFIQVGPLFAPQSLKPDISKISPVKGFGRLFSMRSIFEFLKGLLKISLVGAVSVVILYPFFDSVDHYVGIPIPQMLAEIKFLFARMMIGILVVLAILAIIDVIYQRVEHFKKLRMSRQEIKDEMRQTEGDPHMKGRLRQLRMQKAHQRMIQSVPQADVVITNPTHFAIALRYDQEKDEAPICLAKGVDKVAQRIKEVAKEHGIMTVENVPLARALFDTVEIDEIIPVEHYHAVAEVISYVFRMQGKLKQ